MSVEHSLPPDLTLASPLKIGRGQPALVTTYENGAELSRSFVDRARRTYSGEFLEFRDTSTKLRQYEAWLGHIANRLRPWWLAEANAGYHRGLWCGIGDGARKAFAVPLLGASGVTILVAGTYSESYSLADAANLLADDDASMDAITGWEVAASCILAQADGLSADRVYSLMVTPSAAAANGAQLTDAACPAVTVGEQYTALASARGAGSARVRISWLDSGYSVLNTSTGTTTALSATAWTQLTVTGTAPASAAYARIDVQKTTTETSKWFIDCVGLAPGDFPDWFLPSVAPPVAVFSAAVALNSVIEASGHGRLLAQVRLLEDEETFSQRLTGHSLPSFRARETWTENS